MLSIKLRKNFRAILRDALIDANDKEFASFGIDCAKIVHEKRKGEHFVDRFLERYSHDEESFKKVIKAFIGMIRVRRNFYLSVKDEREFKYNYFNHVIYFIVRRGGRCPNDENGYNVTIALKTII